MITEQDIQSINPSEAFAWCKLGNCTEEQRATALYWRGIITQAEYFATVGNLSDADILSSIDQLKVLTAAWLAS